MTVFLTGATGFIGSYVAVELLRHPPERLALLVRAESLQEARQRLWQAWQLHLDFERFEAALGRVDLYLGDLTRPGLGLEEEGRRRLVHSLDSVIHTAAALNRRSDKVCFNVNLRGTLEVLKIARAASDHHGLRRFSEVSTVAVAGKRQDEVVQEDQAIEWTRSDYDPYARTKKFSEHLTREWLPDVSTLVFRPSIVLGDSRFPETTQFDMARAFVLLARIPVIPLPPAGRIDIVPADFVGRAIAAVHQKEHPRHDIYHLSAGQASPTFQAIVDQLRNDGLGTRPVFLPELGGPFAAMVQALGATPRRWGLSRAGSLLQVFWPYLEFNTVFDNTRICQELGETPASFLDYAYGLYGFARGCGFRYPYQPWPEDRPGSQDPAPRVN